MSKVALVNIVYNSMKYIPKVFPSVLNQTHKNSTFYVVIAGNENGEKEFIQENYPEIVIIDPGYNIGFAKGHNELFSSIGADFFQLVNPDLVLTENFVEEMLKPFEDPNIGAVSGKILQYDFEKNSTTNIIDTTGVLISKSGRGRDRGQHEVDSGQYDTQTNLIAVSGAAAMYRKSALESVKYTYPNRHVKAGQTEYFDEEFFMYWEDVDLSWRIVNSGWKIQYNPKAIAYHGRTAASSPGGYKKVLQFIKHHKKISSRILEWNYKNHIFMFIKNSPKFYFKFFQREIFYQIYVLVFESATLKILPTFFKQLKSMWQKRKFIQSNRKISIEDMENLFTS